MISYIDGNVYFQIPPQSIDTLAVAMLKEGRDVVSQSISDTFNRILENDAVMQHHICDITDNMKYLEAFNTLLEFYGAGEEEECE